MRGILRFLRTTPRHPGNHCPHRLVIVAARMQMTVKLECRRPPQRTWSLSWTRTVSSAIADLLPLDGGEPVPETCLVECWFLESSQHPPHCLTQIHPPSIRPSTPSSRGTVATIQTNRVHLGAALYAESVADVSILAGRHPTRHNVEINPPSMTKSAPVTFPARSLARSRTKSATSWG